MLNIVIDSDIPFLEGVLEPYASISYVKGTQIDSSAVRNADALVVRTRTKCGRELLEGSKVKLICTATIGYDHIDNVYCSAAGIKVANAAGCNARAVLQWVAAALNHIAEKQGWKPGEKSIGVVGCGNVGSLVAYYAGIWGFDVKCCDPFLEKEGRLDPVGRSFVGYESIIKSSDIITFHVPFTREGEYPTYHMADDRFFENIKGGTVILNSSRGEVVDTVSFRQAAAGGKCFAAVDTWENEPDIDPVLLEKALAATPHIAGYSIQGKANASAIAVRNIAEYFGLPLSGWYPEGVLRSNPEDITWSELRRTIPGYFDIVSQTDRLRSCPADFEDIRNSYDYRQEYF